MKLVRAIFFSACLALTGCGGDDTDEAMAEAKKGFVDSCAVGVDVERCECIWDEMLEAEGEDKMIEHFTIAGSEGTVSPELRKITEDANAACA